MKSFVAFLWKRHRARETSSPSPPFSITRYPQRRHSSFYYCRVIFRPCALALLRLADQLTSGRLWNISRFKLAAREIDARKVNEIVEGRRMYHRWWRCSRFEVFLPCNLFFASIPLRSHANERRKAWRIDFDPGIIWELEEDMNVDETEFIDYRFFISLIVKDNVNSIRANEQRKALISRRWYLRRMWACQLVSLWSWRIRSTDANERREASKIEFVNRRRMFSSKESSFE